MKLEAGFATDIGRRRSQNQDSGASWSDLGLFVVADGMGGHRGGEIASNMAVEAIFNVIKKDLSRSRAHPKEVLTEAVKHANSTIFTRSRNEAALQGMGTTATTLWFTEDKLSVAHVGDSRCYLLSGEAIWQLTRDHSLVQEKLRAGLITREQSKTDRMKNVITRSVGFDAPFAVDVYEYQPKPSDLFLACSDGLSGQLEDSEILALVRSHADAPGGLQTAVDALIHAANDHGGDDNITALLVRYNG